MNKKGIAPIALVLAIFIGIVLLIFLGSGGIVATYNLSRIISDMVNAMSQIPTIIWVVLGIIIVLKMMGGKK